MIKDQDVRIENYVLLCYNDVGAALYWRIFLFAYLAVLQILGIMLAFQTRKVKVKSLKDSTFVVANVYISSIIIVIFIIITFVLRSYLNVYSSLFATGIFILTTSFLILMFVPKVIKLCMPQSTINCTALTIMKVSTFSYHHNINSSHPVGMSLQCIHLHLCIYPCFLLWVFSD